MDKEEIIVLALAGVAVFMILKAGGVMKSTAAATSTPDAGFLRNWDTVMREAAAPDYVYDNDETGALFSATGADVRARR